jgi:sporulation protein YlmC with PRC-barrel domain
MGSFSAASLLQQPVSLRGIALGRPTDLLLDLEQRQVVGFVVRCGDESVRFLPYGASQPGDEGIAVQSALMLVEDVAFYRKRGISFRSLLGGEVERAGRTAGVLRDLVVGRGGAVEELELERGGSRRRVPASGSTVIPTRASAA